MFPEISQKVAQERMRSGAKICKVHSKNKIRLSIFVQFCGLTNFVQLAAIKTKRNVRVKGLLFISWIYLHFTFSWNCGIRWSILCSEFWLALSFPFVFLWLDKCDFFYLFQRLCFLSISVDVHVTADHTIKATVNTVPGKPLFCSNDYISSRHAASCLCCFSSCANCLRG